MPHKTHADISHAPDQLRTNRRPLRGPPPDPSEDQRDEAIRRLSAAEGPEGAQPPLRVRRMERDLLAVTAVVATLALATALYLIGGWPLMFGGVVVVTLLYAVGATPLIAANRIRRIERSEFERRVDDAAPARSQG